MKPEQNGILDLIGRIWAQHPELRFNQLIDHLQNKFSSSHNGMFTEILFKKDTPAIGNPNNMIFEEVRRVDLFNLADKQFLEFLYKELGSNAPFMKTTATLNEKFIVRTGGEQQEFQKAYVYDVVAQVKHPSFKSGVGYVIMHPMTHITITLDSNHLNFDYKEEN